MLRRVQNAVKLSPQTVSALDTVFDQRSLNLRDAMAHGAFFAADEERLAAVLAGLSHGLANLTGDLHTARLNQQVYDAPRWDAGWVLPEGVRQTIREQYQPEHNLRRSFLDRPDPQRACAELMAVLMALTPDKWLMCQAAFLLWVSGQMEEGQGQGDDTHHFAAILAGLAALEELFRASYEVHSQSVLRTCRDGTDRVKCELAILDDQPRQLLDPQLLRSVFGELYEQEEFRQGLVAVRTIRDAVLHGAWSALTDPPVLYSHLVMKLLFTICETVGVK